MNKGEVIDSMLYDESQSVSSKKIPTLTGYDEVYTFADGSIIVTQTEELDKLIENQYLLKEVGITGGSTSGGSGYVNATNRYVYYNIPGVAHFSFYANYSYVKGGYDSISWVGNHSVSVIGGSSSDQYLRRIRTTENAGGKAEARLSANITPYGLATMSKSISLIVGGDTATARGNGYY